MNIIFKQLTEEKPPGISEEKYYTNTFFQDNEQLSKYIKKVNEDLENKKNDDVYTNKIEKVEKLIIKAQNEIFVLKTLKANGYQEPDKGIYEIKEKDKQYINKLLLQLEEYLPLLEGKLIFLEKQKKNTLEDLSL